jgi:ATP synthase protein I
MPFDWKRTAALTQIVYSFPAAVFVPAFLGWLLDKYLGTKPWFLFLGFVLGLVAGFLMVFRQLASEKDE